MKSSDIDRDTLIAFAKGKLSPDESQQVLAALEADRQLSQQLEEVLLMIRGAEAAREVREGDGESGGTVREPAFRYILGIAAVLVLTFIAVTSVSELGKNRYHDLARLNSTTFAARFRGDDGDQIELARTMFLNGEHDAAIGELERILRIRPAGESMAAVQVMLGEMLLATAERSIVGLFPAYDRNRVTRALELLDAAVQSGDLRLAGEAHWLRMKGFLMLADRDAAIREGTEIAKSGGHRAEAALECLNRIERE